MNRMDVISETAFDDALKDKSNHYLITLVQRVVILLKEGEKTLPHGLKAPYSGAALDAYLQSISDSREKLLDLVKFVYADPYLNLLLAQDALTRTIGYPTHSPVASPRVASPVSPSSIFNDFKPKKRGGSKKRKTRQKRTRRGASRLRR